ncbi:hypothetical protein AB3N62_11280 [Leptospira sp. WS4.C2]
MENYEKEKSKNKIAETNNYFRIIIISLFTAVFLWKISTSTIEVDLTKFDFNALLSTLLALFSVGLSVFFYFKATDTSNLFYDNTYKFTKDISEILGRIEAGFGERLRHLDEGYSGLRDKFGNTQGIIQSSQSIEKTSQEIEEEKQKLEQQMKEKEEILVSLMNRAKLQEKEKSEIIQSIKTKDDTIHTLSKELHYLKKKLQKEEHLVSNELYNQYPRKIIELLRSIILESVGPDFIMEAPMDIISDRLLPIIRENLPQRFIVDLKEFDILNKENQLTSNGINLLKNIARRSIH